MVSLAVMVKYLGCDSPRLTAEATVGSAAGVGLRAEVFTCATWPAHAKVGDNGSQPMAQQPHPTLPRASLHGRLL